MPAGATPIDGARQVLVPGFVDTNVHLSLYGGMGDRYETLARYHPRQREIVLEAGADAVEARDHHGARQLRRAERRSWPCETTSPRGDAIGPRILAAGNIVGWGGPYSISFSLTRDTGLTLFQEQINDDIAQGAGEDLVDMDPAELRTAIRAYLDKGPDFLKFGGTAHFARPAFIGFSPEAQKVIVDEAHARGRSAETHATTADGLRLSIEAGIDGIQHPELLGPTELPDALVRAIVERKIVCSMLVEHDHRRRLEEASAAIARRRRRSAARPRRKGSPIVPARARRSRQRQAEDGLELEMRRKNAQKLIAAGAVVTLGTDNYWAAAAEFSRTPKPEAQDHGIGTIMAIEGLVELGMTPAQAIVAATRNGAIASRGIEQFGTIETGKRADLLLLDADPLDDIRNIRKLSRSCATAASSIAARCRRSACSRALPPPPAKQPKRASRAHSALSGTPLELHGP